MSTTPSSVLTTTTEHERKDLNRKEEVIMLSYNIFTNRNWVVLNKGDEDSFIVPVILCFGRYLYIKCRR